MGISGRTCRERKQENAMEGSRSIHDLPTPIRLFFSPTSICRVLESELGESFSRFCGFRDDFFKPYFTTFRTNRVDECKSNFSLV